MKKPVLSMIVAVDKNGAIGAEEKLLWDIPEDRKRFKELTMGHPVILGRKTFESILSYIHKPLPGRTNIVVTRDQNYSYEGCITTHSIEEAIKRAKEIDKGEIFVGGGGSIYRQALPYTNRLYITLVEVVYPEADTYFFDYSDFKKKIKEENHISSKGVKYKFQILER